MPNIAPSSALAPLPQRSSFSWPHFVRFPSSPISCYAHDSPCHLLQPQAAYFLGCPPFLSTTPRSVPSQPFGSTALRPHPTPFFSGASAALARSLRRTWIPPLLGAAAGAGGGRGGIISSLLSPPGREGDAASEKVTTGGEEEGTLSLLQAAGRGKKRQRDPGIRAGRAARWVTFSRRLAMNEALGRCQR